jgi:hypothetical protein
MTMRVEWLRAGDHTPACWAGFLVFDTHVEILAMISATEHVDQSVPTDEARTVWADLCARGWQRATDADVDRHQMTFKRLREIIYGRARRRR